MQMTQSLNEPVTLPLVSHPSYFLDLPCELHLQVMSFLSMGSIRNLMANRLLRPTCEKGLYTRIFLRMHPRRSLRLLETFIIRPDLALLVRHLEICGFYCEQASSLINEIPKVLEPDGTNALSLAKNIHSLALVGPRDWIYNPTRTGFRDTLSKMKLNRLKICRVFEPPRWLGCAPTTYRIWEGDLFEEIRTVLRAQPLLASFSLEYCSFSGETVRNLQSRLSPSDAPMLKHLIGDPDIAGAFISALSGLRCLDITGGCWEEETMTLMEQSPAANRASIWKLSLQMRDLNEQIWILLGRVLTLFPNTTTLQLEIPKYNPDERFEKEENYCSIIIRAISSLPALRHLEVTGEMYYLPNKEVAGGQNSFMTECKRTCPELKTFQDHMGRLWEYGPEWDGWDAGVAKLIAEVKMEHQDFREDLSPLSTRS